MVFRCNYGPKEALDILKLIPMQNINVKINWIDYTVERPRNKKVVQDKVKLLMNNILSQYTWGNVFTELSNNRYLDVNINDLPKDRMEVVLYMKYNDKLLRIIFEKI